MDTIGKRIESMRVERGLSKTDIWKAAGLSSGVYAQWMNGSKLSAENLVKVAAILGVTTEWLATGLEPKYLDDEVHYYPRVIGTAQMGDQGYYLDLDGGDGYVEFESEPGSVAIRVRGSSMHPAIRDGWFVIIEPSGRPTPGEYVLLNFKDGRKMVKELLHEKADHYVVMSVNSGERFTATKEELHDIRAITAVIPPSKHKR